MSEAPGGVENDPMDDRPRGRRHPLLLALVAVLALECTALAAATVFLVLELLVAPASSIASAIALAVVAAIATVWVGFIAAHTLRGRAWIRGGAIVVQVLLLAVAIGSFQGVLPRADIGIVLLIPAVAVLVLLFTKPVVAATSIRDTTPTL